MKSKLALFLCYVSALAISQAYCIFDQTSTCDRFSFDYGGSTSSVSCHSRPDETSCDDGIDCCKWVLPFSNNENETSCAGYIVDYNMRHIPGIPPQPRTCPSSFETPDLYRDLSCCTNAGAAQFNSYGAYAPYGAMFDFSWINDIQVKTESLAVCATYVQIMNMMLCDPNQGEYIVESEVNFPSLNSKKMNVCLSTCQKVYEVCAGLYKPSRDTYYGFEPRYDFTDAESMCYSSWNGPSNYDLAPNEGEKCSTSEYYDYVELQWVSRTTFLCEQNVTLNVLPASSDCLSMVEPPEELLEYQKIHVRNSNNYDEDGNQVYIDMKYPSGCESSSSNIWNIWKLVGIIAGSIVGCLCLSCGAFLCYRSKQKSYSDPSPESPQNHEYEEGPAESKPESVQGYVIGTKTEIVPTAPPLSLRDLKLIKCPPPYAPQGSKDGSKDDVIYIPQEAVPVPELSFIQKLDIREIDDQRAMGSITEAQYLKQKKQILDSAYM